MTEHESEKSGAAGSERMAYNAQLVTRVRSPFVKHEFLEGPVLQEVTTDPLAAREYSGMAEFPLGIKAPFFSARFERHGFGEGISDAILERQSTANGQNDGLPLMINDDAVGVLQDCVAKMRKC